MQVTEKVYLIAEPIESYNFDKGVYENKVKFFAWPYDSHSENKAVACLDVTFDVAQIPSHYDLKMEQLLAEKKKLQADFQARITQITAQINELTAIEG